ncbi:MAG: replication endonuclease [Oleiphilaceae bacterium]|nr:replication endonuclease [Oleiphilaceae bacterium]
MSASLKLSPALYDDRHPQTIRYLKEEGRAFAVSDRYGRELLREVEEKHPFIQKAVKQRYLRICDNSNFHRAIIWLEKILTELRIGATIEEASVLFGLKRVLKADCYLDEIDLYAKAMASKVEREFYDIAYRLNVRASISRTVNLITHTGIEFPLDKKDIYDRDKIQPALERTFCHNWWKRQLKQVCFKKSETIYRDLGLTNASNGLYISDFNFKRYLNQQASNRKVLEKMEVINEDEEAIPLIEVHEKSVSNPLNRRNELMTRISGLEKIANSTSDKGFMLTLTCPSKFHCSHKSGKRNAKHNELSPADGQAYLNDIWKLIRTAWSNKGIKPYGIRVAEPHHDGTPHWHQLLFFRSEQAQEALEIFKLYAHKEDENESGANEHRTDIVPIDSSKGTATGYVAKYIAKNVDGYQINEEDGKCAVEKSLRVRAWASIWGIRQFQFIGSPSVTVYRELRRLRNIEGVRPTLIAALETAADKGDFAKFVELMGGVSTKRVDQPLRAMMVKKSEPNRYSETAEKLKGLIGSAGKIVTRIHDWHMQKRKRNPDNFISKERSSFYIRGANAPPWSSVNKCT